MVAWAEKDVESLGSFPVASPYLVVSVAGDRPGHWPMPAGDGVKALALDMSPKHHRGFWAMQLDEAVQGAREPHVVIAQGLAALAVVRWAQLSPKRYLENVAGAWFIAPMSFGSGQAALARTLLPSPTMRLPFPSVVVDSRASSIIVHVLALADIWQSRFVDAEKFPGWPGGDVPRAAERAALAELAGV